MDAMIEKMLMPVVLAGCYALGMALKSTKWYPNSMIPLTLFFVGAVLAPLVSGVFTVECMIIGAVTGWAAVGLNQTIKQVGKDEESTHKRTR